MLQGNVLSKAKTYTNPAGSFSTSIIISALFAFLTSFDDVIISIFLSGGGNSTLTKQMFNALRDYIDPTIAAISTLMIILSTTLMLGAQYLGKQD